MNTRATAKPPSGLERLLESPRAQRRALVAGLAIFALGAAAFVFVFFRNTGTPLPDKLSNQPATIVKNQPTVALDPAVVPLAKDFISTAVARKNLGHAYDIVGPEIRGGMTRAQFEKGNIPVVPYPADDVAHLAYKVDYSHPRQARLEVGLNPKANSPGTRRLTFFIGFKKIGNGASAHWVVNYWEPRYHPPVPVTQ